jgi:integrase
MRIKLTPAFVARANLAPDTYWDTSLRCFGLKVTDTGHRSYVVQYRNRQRISRQMSLSGVLNLSEARREARVILGQVAKGADPLSEKRQAAQASEDTVRAIAENFLRREGLKLRSAGERRKTFERLIFPAWGSRQVDSIRRSDVVKLLDAIEDKSGPRMAQVALAYISRLFTWHAGRSDDFRSPIIRGMGRVNVRERARTRILTDDELRAVWAAAEAAGGLFDRYVQFLLLTACRRNEAAEMTRAELDGANWLIPATRMKGKQDHLIPLSRKARDTLAKLPTIGKPDGFVFTNDGVHAFCNFAHCKSALQARSGTSGWTLHDLRRTARSLMSRAGVDSDHAERCLAHVIVGVRGTYDRHSYRDEKLRAFEALAALIERIVDPAENVVGFSAASIPVSARQTS